MAEQSNGQPAPSVGKKRSRPRVLIIGGGFAGLHAARGLAKLPVDVTLVDRRNHHVFQPLLYQVALGILSPADIAQPIRSMLRRLSNVEFLMDEAIGFDKGHRNVQMKSGMAMTYDYLMVATGATHSYFGKDEWADLAPGLKTIEDATHIRRCLITAFELAEREMVKTGSHPLLNFIIIGGGPTGVELAGAISDITKNFMHGYFRKIDPSKARVIILEGSPHVLAAYPEDLQQKARNQLEKFGVEVRTNARVTDVQPGYVMLGDERIEATVTLWGAGVQASPLGKLLGAEVDKRGCVVVNEHLNPAGHSEIFVCGDLAHVTEAGRQLPGVAQPAMQMGDHVARMIAQDIAGKPRTSFHYFDKGDMSTIGRFAAVAKIEWPFKAHWGGFMAWLSWAAVHIFFLVGFRNRLGVLFQWLYTMVTSSFSASLITGESSQSISKSEARPPATNAASTAASTLHVAGFVALVSALGLLTGCSKPPAPAGPAALPVPVVAATQQNVPLTGEWVATTDGFVNAQIQPQVSGYLLRQDYKEGSQVHRGQVLFEIDPAPLQAVLDQATASVGQAKAQVAQAQAQLALQNINVKRDTPLAQVKAIAQSQLDNETQTQQADQASVAAAEAQVRAAEAQVHAAQINLGFTKVRSINDGVAGQATVQVGNLVGPSAVLTTVSQLNPIKVYFAISEQEYIELFGRAKQRGANDLLASGNTIPLTLTLSNGQAYPHPGRIIFVDRSISAQTGSIRMAASFPNPGNFLRPGQFGRISAETDVKQNAIVIPQRALNELQGVNQVIVVGPNNVAQIRSVMLGPQVGTDNIVILSGVNVGDRVVTQGLDKIKDGMKLAPQNDNTPSSPAAGQNQKEN